MNIGIDAFALEHGCSGYGTYLISLVANLQNDTDIKWTIFGQEIDRYTFNKDNKFSYIGLDNKDTKLKKWLWRHFSANRFYKKNSFDAVLYPAASILPVIHSKATAIAVVSGVATNRNVLHSLRHTKFIIASSEYIKQDLMKKGVAKNKITVIYNGIDHGLFFPKPNIESEVISVSPFAIKRPYFVYVSKLKDASKKHIELIKAFEIFKKETNAPHRLVIAGADGNYIEEVHKAAFASSAASDIFLTGFFPHESLPDLYRGATACLFPASNEGTGLPVLEAMACSLPVACSNRGVLREITGGNALLFDCDNIKQIADIMKKIVNDSNMVKSLSQKGLSWAANFSWDKTAVKTVALIRNLLFNRV